MSGNGKNEQKPKEKEKEVKVKTSRNPLIRSAIQPALHPPAKPKPETTNVRHLKIVEKDDDPDDAA